MTVEQAVADRLAADAGVQALVSSRVYQLRLPQSPTYPAVRVLLVDEPEAYHQRGPVNLTRARVQIDAYAGENSADPYGAATDLAAAVNAALGGMRFQTADSPPSLEVVGAFRDSRRVMYEPEELRLVRVSQDYIVWSAPLS